MTRLIEDTQSYVGKAAVDAAIVAIPLVGESILALTGEIARERFRERTIEMFSIMRDQVAALGETRLDKAYFQSEEFHTLLLIAWEQLRTTHDKRKIRMLATALSNSGRTDFSSEQRKELFLRIVHDLSPLEVEMLKGMVPADEPPYIRRGKTATGETQPTLARLVALGLVEENFESKPMPSLPNIGPNITEREISRFLKEALQRVPTRVYDISEFGAAFIKFLTDEVGTG